MNVETIATRVSISSIVVAASDQIGCDLGGEEVILDLHSGIYFGLNEVGASIWKLIQKPTSVAGIVDAILDEYEVERERCEPGILRVLNELAERNLISVSNAAN